MECQEIPCARGIFEIFGIIIEIEKKGRKIKT